MTIEVMGPPFKLIYAPEILEQLMHIERKHHTLIRTTIEEQLLFDPGVETRNRKPLRRPASFGATWELRFGPSNRFRVFYRMSPVVREVYLLAIGQKRRDRLVIGSTEYDL